MELSKEERDEARFWSKVATGKRNNSCWDWDGAHFSSGYPGFWLDNTQKRAHRVMWTFVNGDIPNGICVLHKCDNRGCVNPSHLFLGTHSDNMKDMVSKKRKRGGPRRGEKHHGAKLTNAQVLEIRSRLKRSEWGIISSLAKEFDVAHTTISKIKRNKTWN